MKLFDCCKYLVVTSFLLTWCCAGSDTPTVATGSQLGTTNFVLRLSAIVDAPTLDRSAMRANIRQLITEKDPKAVHVLLDAYHRDKESYILGLEIPVLVIQALEQIKTEEANSAILQITRDTRVRGPASLPAWHDRKYCSTLRTATPILANLGKQGLDELQAIYSSPNAGRGPRVDARKHILLKRVRRDERENKRATVEALVSQLSREPSDWFEGGTSASIDNQAVMDALQSLGSSVIPYLRDEVRRVTAMMGPDDVVAIQVATLADIMEWNEARRLERQKQDVLPEKSFDR